MPKLCEFETCRKQASYGEFYGKPVYCKQHKDKFVLVSQLCEQNFCNKTSSYNFDGLKSKFCFEHKEENMILVRGKF